MKYRKDKYGNDLSILGYGCMRFPRKHGKIDMEIAEDFYLASSVSKYYFVNIAKYIINLCGFDYDNMVNEFLSVIR